MKNETKIIIWISVVLLLSLLGNGFLIGSINTPTTDYTEQLSLYKQLNSKSDLAEGLLQDRITEAEKEISRLGSISDELRETNRALKEANIRREQLDTVADSLGGRIRAEVIGGINSIDSGSGRITELERSEQAERRSLEGVLESNGI